MKKHVTISFVPVRNNPYLFFNSKQQKVGEGGIKYYTREVVQGYFVTRVRVRPMNGTDVYYWYNNKRQSTEMYDQYCQVIINNELKRQSIPSMTKMLTKRIQLYYIPSNLTER